MQNALLCLLLLFTFLTNKSSSVPAKSPAAQSSVVTLFDAFSKDSSLKKGWGFSCLIKHNGKTILFDGGSNADIFKYNVQRLKIDLKKVDIVVVSHSHHDHVNGIDYVLSINPKVKIYFPNDLFFGATHVFDVSGQDSSAKDSLPSYMQYYEGKQTKIEVTQAGGRFWGSNIEFVKESKEIIPGIRLVATKANYMGYFSSYPNKSFVEGAFNEEKNEVRFTPLPELSLALKTNNGEALFVGCSHTGVENIVKQTQKETSDKIHLVYGGFHLIPFDRKEVTRMAEHFKDSLKVEKVAPAHCTGHLAFKIFRGVYQENYLYAGLGETVIF